MHKQAFSTSDIARICHHSRETVKRWLEKGEIKGYRVEASGHWRVLPGDLRAFLQRNGIPFPDPGETGVSLAGMAGTDTHPLFCWQFFKDSTSDHVGSKGSCRDCMVYKTKALKCHTLREEIGHEKVICSHSCAECDYFLFQRRDSGSQT